MLSPDLKLSLGVQYDAQLREGAEEEIKAWAEQGSVSGTFEENCGYLEKQIRDRAPLFRVFQGFTIALRSIDPFVAEIGPDRVEVSKAGRQRWGFRPIATLSINSEELTPQRIGPPIRIADK